MSDKFAMQSWPLRRYEFPMPIRYHLTETTGPGVVLAIHGYQDHALSMIQRLGWWERKDLPFQLCAINGPFPVPIWKADGFVEAYSWYFRDASRDLEFVSPEATASRLKLLLQDIGLENTPKVIVGFSMGGFLAPYLAAEIKNVKGIVGIGCGYNVEAYEKIAPLTVHAVHGEEDERIAIAGSKSDFAKVLAVGHKGRYHAIPGLVHRVEPSIEPLVRQLAFEELAK